MSNKCVDELHTARLIGCVTWNTDAFCLAVLLGVWNGRNGFHLLYDLYGCYVVIWRYRRAKREDMDLVAKCNDIWLINESLLKLVVARKMY